MKRNLEPYESIVDVVGWTPLVRLKRIARGWPKAPAVHNVENFEGAEKARAALFGLL